MVKTFIALRQGSDKLWVYALELARPRGFEPLTLGLENRRPSLLLLIYKFRIQGIKFKI